MGEYLVNLKKIGRLLNEASKIMSAKTFLNESSFNFGQDYIDRIVRILKEAYDESYKNTVEGGDVAMDASGNISNFGILDNKDNVDRDFESIERQIKVLIAKTGVSLASGQKNLHIMVIEKFTELVVSIVELLGRARAVN